MLTTHKALDQYFHEHIEKKCVAVDRAEFAIKALKKGLSDDPIKDIDIPTCRDYGDSRGVSDSTVRRELGVLHAAAEHAVKWRRLSMADMPSIELPPANDNAQIWFFEDELAHLLDTAETFDHKVYRFVQLAYHTASRRAAIESLQWPQVDTDSRRINLAKTGERRTNKRRPLVSISEAMADELVLMRKSATNQWVLGDSAAIYNRFVRTTKRAGLHELPQRGLRQEGSPTPHSLRHSRATHLLQAGKDPWLVANLLGDNLTTVLRTYGHACPAYMASIHT